MVRRKELIKVLLDFDVDLCNLMNDLEGKSKVVQTWREYQKVIAYLTGLEFQISRFTKIPKQQVKESCRQAYERWKSKSTKSETKGTR
jgi:hypothetical protein